MLTTQASLDFIMIIKFKSSLFNNILLMIFNIAETGHYTFFNTTKMQGIKMSIEYH